MKMMQILPSKYFFNEILIYDGYSSANDASPIHSIWGKAWVQIQMNVRKGLSVSNIENNNYSGICTIGK